ncbi:MAG: flagellar basal body protein [Deferribacteraceae bacterium]|jgi:flagellar basal-body rod protein FlgC|nr:flagellar basal body protein [Deferribacteraceae bacterium]
MLNAVNSASSALRAYTEVINTTAHNVANINTEGYTPQRVHLSEARGGGVKATAESIRNPAEVRQDAYISEKNSVNYAAEAANQITSLRSFQANTGVIRTADEMLGTLINTTV